MTSGWAALGPMTVRVFTLSVSFKGRVASWAPQIRISSQPITFLVVRMGSRTEVPVIAISWIMAISPSSGIGCAAPLGESSSPTRPRPSPRPCPNAMVRGRCGFGLAFRLEKTLVGGADRADPIIRKLVKGNALDLIVIDIGADGAEVFHRGPSVRE